MNHDTLKKVLIGVVIAVVAFPAFISFFPEAHTMESLRAGFDAKGWNVDDFQEIQPPGLESARQVNMLVRGAYVELYQYDDVGKLAKQYEYQKPGSGEGIANSMGIASSLGARTKEPPPFVAGKNGMFMIVTTGLDKPQLLELVRVFQSL